MLRINNICSRRPYFVLLTGFLLFVTVPFLFFRSGPFRGLHSWFTDRIRHGHGSAIESAETEFYEWDTRSQFTPLDRSYAENASIEELCRAFPHHVLEDVQPVLKTGHAVLEDRLRPQLESVSACLDNLLIFSDLDEEFEGHELIDAIGEIPTSLRESDRASEPDQLGSYNIQKAFAANNSLPTLNTTALKGWKTDKFKFLPTISLTWKKRPERPWYVFHEDDTYVVWDNVFRMLENFDADKPHYFGSPSPGCHDQGTEVWFANGGPGFILSREAMRRLVKDDWDSTTGEYLGPKLQEENWGRTLDNCCGDSLLGCVLHKKGVSLSGLWPMFDVHRPHRTPFSKDIWCQPVITMHKPSAKDIRGLWRWEWEHREVDRPLLWRDVAMTYWRFADLTTDLHWDNTGRSSFKAKSESEYYSHDPHESFIACQRACEALPDCVQYTFHLRKCKLDRSLRYGESRPPELGKIGKDLSEEEAMMEWSQDDLTFWAGWDVDTVQKFIAQRPCETVQWVKPSLERVF